MKLNLGCGYYKLKGWLNVDVNAACNPDQVVDLEQFPWPWEDNSVSHLLMSHVLEHLGESRACYFEIIKELYRVCEDKAIIIINVPHPRHDHFLDDPTHVRPITVAGLSMFDKCLNQYWIDTGLGNTPLGIYLNVDFQVIKAEHRLDPKIQKKLDLGEISKTELPYLMGTQNNMCQEINIELKAIKS